MNHQVVIKSRKSDLTGGGILLSVIHKLINSVWNEEELLHQWKEPVIVPIYKRDHETDYGSYLGI
jgi:hypothetical protein